MKSVGAFFVFVSLVFLPFRSEAAILINEFLADPPAGLLGDANRDGVRDASDDEFAEFLNTGPAPVSLSAWSFWDSVALRHTFSVSATIPSNGFFLLFGGGDPFGFENVETSSTGSLSLNNSGDTLFLRDPDGTLIDSVLYGSEGNHDTSLTRSPDGHESFLRHSSVNTRLFSPEATVDGHDRFSDPRAVPEPTSLLLMGFGLLGLARKRRFPY